MPEKISIESGIHISKKKGFFSDWYEVCEEWILLNERYCRLMNCNDAAYAYKEMANLSIFSGAVFRAGWVSVAESSIQKQGGPREARSGRSDLCILGPSHKEEIYIEAKSGIRKIPYKIESGDRIENILSKACEDASHINSKNRVGMAFIRFSCLKDPNNSDSHDEIVASIEGCVENDKNELVAWCFPKEMRSFQFDGNMRYYPGVILAARKVG